MSITDSPRFPWRGMHLDVARYFMPLATVKKVIDLLALHKAAVSLKGGGVGLYRSSNFIHVDTGRVRYW